MKNIKTVTIKEVIEEEIRQSMLQEGDDEPLEDADADSSSEEEEEESSTPE